MSTRREFLTYASLAARLPALNPTALAAAHASPLHRSISGLRGTADTAGTAVEMETGAAGAAVAGARVNTVAKAESMW